MLKDESISDKTKQSFANAFKVMIKTKSLSKITITELCKQCHVNRKTFYYHFNDINDLVLWIFQKEVKETTHLKFSFPHKMEDSLYYLIDYIDENRHMCEAIFHSCYRIELRILWLSEIKELIEKTVISIEEQYGKEKKNRELLIDFFVGATSELIISYAIQNNNRNYINQRIAFMIHLFEVAMKEE